MAVPGKRVVTFPRGLLGLADLHRFELTMPTGDHPLGWLQPVDEPAIGFVVVDPFAFKPGYQVQVSEPIQRLLGLDDQDTPLILAIVRVPDDPAAMTANLLGPLVINVANDVGCQVVLSQSGYTPREPLLARRPEAAPC